MMPAPTTPVCADFCQDCTYGGSWTACIAGTMLGGHLAFSRQWNTRRCNALWCRHWGNSAQLMGTHGLAWQLPGCMPRSRSVGGEGVGRLHRYCVKLQVAHHLGSVVVRHMAVRKPDMKRP